MIVNILIHEYKKLLKDIFNEYINIIEKHNEYSKFLKIVDCEFKEIMIAFNTLVGEKKNTFKDIFEYDVVSILYTIDKDLFDHIKNIFENVSAMINAK